MISKVLQLLIESRGCMTIDDPHHPGSVRLDWFARDGTDWHAVASLTNGPHVDVEFAMDEVLYHYERQRYCELRGERELAEGIREITERTNFQIMTRRLP